jgi:hypothetical protein
MTNIEQMQLRIARKGIQAADIKHEKLLTQHQIQMLDLDKVYMWVRTGDWKQKDFKKWLKALRVME